MKPLKSFDACQKSCRNICTLGLHIKQLTEYMHFRKFASEIIRKKWLIRSRHSYTLCTNYVLGCQTFKTFPAQRFWETVLKHCWTNICSGNLWGTHRCLARRHWTMLQGTCFGTATLKLFKLYMHGRKLANGNLKGQVGVPGNPRILTAYQGTHLWRNWIR